MLPLVIWMGVLGAMAGPPQEPPRFRSSADLVVVHVSVLARSGYVAGLPQDAFTIRENGEPQTITFFENTDSPVSVGLVVDNSISMMRRRRAVIDAGVEFLRARHPADELFVLHFNERVWHALPPDLPFSSDPRALTRALERMTARGQTALFDALQAGLRHLAGATRQKKVLVVLSDGGDNASASRFDDVLDAALRMDAVIYTVSIEDPYDRDGNPRLLRRLAGETGGEAFFVRDVEQMSGVLDRIGRDIRSGYTIGYVPRPGDDQPAYRQISVEVAPQRGQRLKVRARSGYVAAPLAAER